MNYLILSQNSLGYGWELSSALWKLSSPESVQKSNGRQTKYWSRPIQHSDGRVALPLPENDEFIHPESDLSALAEFISTAPQEEQDAVAETIAAHKGKRMGFAEALSAAPSFAEQTRTQEQMEAEGWFSQDDL